VINRTFRRQQQASQQAQTTLVPGEIDTSMGKGCFVRPEPPFSVVQYDDAVAVSKNSG